jgi:hypothetical protein
MLSSTHLEGRMARTVKLAGPQSPDEQNRVDGAETASAVVAVLTAEEFLALVAEAAEQPAVQPLPGAP